MHSDTEMQMSCIASELSGKSDHELEATDI